MRILKMSLLSLTAGVFAFIPPALFAQDVIANTDSAKPDLSIESPPAPSPANALAGTWGKALIFASETAALGTTSKSKISRFSVVTTTIEGNVLSARETECFIDSLSSGSAKISFPEALQKSIPVRTFEYAITSDESGTALSLVDATEGLGVAAGESLLDLLPTDKADPRYFDQDNDGNPGVTVKVEAKVIFTVSADLYVGQRTVWSESVQQIDDNTLAGPVEWSQEQLILGASNPLFTAVKPEVKVLPEESSVQFRKLPEGAGCAELKSLRDSLFVSPTL